MARIYADEQYPFPVVKILRNLGHDVLTVLEAGKANQKIRRRLKPRLYKPCPPPRTQENNVILTAFVFNPRTIRVLLV